MDPVRLAETTSALLRTRLPGTAVAQSTGH
jgi:hypothetical protein